jgi:hypothetical protein
MAHPSMTDYIDHILTIDSSNDVRINRQVLGYVIERLVPWFQSKFSTGTPLYLHSCVCARIFCMENLASNINNDVVMEAVYYHPQGLNKRT